MEVVILNEKRKKDSACHEDKRRQGIYFITQERTEGCGFSKLSLGRR